MKAVHLALSIFASLSVANVGLSQGSGRLILATIKCSASNVPLELQNLTIEIEGTPLKTEMKAFLDQPSYKYIYNSITPVLQLRSVNSSRRLNPRRTLLGEFSHEPDFGVASIYRKDLSVDFISGSDADGFNIQINEYPSLVLDIVILHDHGSPEAHVQLGRIVSEHSLGAQAQCGLRRHLSKCLARHPQPEK